MATISERTFLLKQEWKDLPLPVPIYRNVPKLPAILRIPDRILLHIAPEENALLWIVINASQALLSLFLLIVLLSHLAINDEINSAAGGGTTHEQDGESIALHILGRFDVYNLITTSIWIVEVGTSLWLSSRNRDRLKCHQSIELCFALFFAGHSLYFVLTNHEPRRFAHRDSGHSHNNHDDNASTADSRNTIDLNVTMLLLNICTKMIAFSYAFFLVLQRFKRRQGTEFQEVAWWEDISYGASVPADSQSQFSNTLSQYSNAVMIKFDRLGSQESGEILQ